MIPAMLSREVTIGIRTPAFAVVLSLHAAMLAAFVVLWGGGVPLLPGENLYEQQRLVQAVALAGLLPWAAARCGAGYRGDDLVLLSALTAARPSRVVMVQAAALFILLAAVVAAGLPLMLLARQIAAVPMQTALADLLPALGLAAIAGGSSLAWTLRRSDPLAAWLGATASTILAAALIGSLFPRPAATLLMFGTGIAATALCAARADVSSRYLSGRS